MMRILLSVLILLGLATVASADKRVALVIGNSDYTASFDLSNPANDARDITKALKRHGFDVTTALDADRSTMINVLRDFREKADLADVAMVYYSGHAIEASGENYLIPTDAELLDIRDVPDVTVSLSTILRQTSGARKLRMVVLDACRDNPFIPKMNNPGGYKSVSRGLSRVTMDASNVMVAYAAAEGAVTPDGEPGGNSPYTASFLAALEGPPRDVGLFMRAVGAGMRERTGLQSMPFVYSSLPADELIINPGSTAVPAPSAPETEVEPNAAALDPVSQANPEPEVPEAPQLTEKERAKIIQSELNRLNCGPLVEDGLFGRKSVSALRRFYEHSGSDLSDVSPSDAVLEELKTKSGQICPKVVVRRSTTSSTSSSTRTTTVQKPDPVAYSYNIWGGGSVPFNSRVSANTQYGLLVCLGGRGQTIQRKCSWR